MEHKFDKEPRNSKLMKIGEVAKQSGVGIEALRFYEKSGLLDRPRRTYSGYRMYDEAVLERIAFIKQAQVLGFSLDEIRQLIDHKRKGESPCAEVREIVRRRLKELEEKIKQMRRYRKALATTLSQWNESGELEGHVCGLIESSNMEGTVRTGKLHISNKT
jgi:DNA-binding transcriptional MerR regulator